MTYNEVIQVIDEFNCITRIPDDFVCIIAQKVLDDNKETLFQLLEGDKDKYYVLSKEILRKTNGRTTEDVVKNCLCKILRDL